MFELYKIWAILIWGIIILLLVLVLSLFVFYYRIVHGKARRIIGEITRDIGIALLVGSAFKWSILELSYYIVLFVGAFLILIGTIMKEDEK